MNLIDTHAHLYDETYNDDFDEMLQRAENAGVNKMICVGTDLQSSEKCIHLAEKYHSLYASVGVHPHDASNVDSHYIKELESFSDHPKVVAIGEIGLDYHYDFSPAELQKKVFCSQLELAKSLEMPCIVHNRESNSDLLNCLKLTGNHYGVIHCFFGTMQFANEILNCGFLLSFTGTVTFKRDLNDYKELIKQLTLSQFMLETDSPYLSPIPFRGKRNESAHVKIVAEHISCFLNLPVEEIAEATTSTALNFFKKMQ